MKCRASIIKPALVLVQIAIWTFTGLAVANEPASKVIKTQGRGYLEKRADGLLVMHLRGTSFERGYQRAILQGMGLERQVVHDLMQVCCIIGDGSFEKGLETVRNGSRLNADYIPHKFREELKGMADGLAAIGSKLTYDDLVLHQMGDEILMMDPEGKDLENSRDSTGFPPVSRCSSFSAWGKATRDGELVFGANEDYFDDEVVLKNRPVVIADPTDGGYGYTGGIWNLWYGGGGINEKGIALKGHLSFATDERLRGVTSDILLRMVLQYSDSIEDAVDILASHPRTCGIMVHVADAKTKRAAVIEYTANAIAVRSPQESEDFLWNTNHFNTYPGWQGYEGPSMVPHNKGRTVKDVTSIKAWQKSLAEVNKGPVGRYGRLKQLMNRFHGQIDIENAKEIMSDRFDLKANRKLGDFEQPKEDSALSRILSGYNRDEVFAKNVEFYKSNRRGDVTVKSGSVWSFVANPGSGEIWWSVGDVPPVHYTAKYRRINLKDELRADRTNSKL